jgi:hypothetical protein
MPRSSRTKRAGRAKTARKSASRTAKRTKRATRSPAPGVSRIDQPDRRTHGYFVRLGYARSRDGTTRPRATAFFGDASHGGKKGALRAALAWATARRRELAKEDARGTRRR